MIHAGRLTLVIFALLDGMSKLDSDCLSGEFNASTVGEQCPEDRNFLSQYCRCTRNATMRIRYIIEKARNSSIDYANTEKIMDLEDTVSLLRQVYYNAHQVLHSISYCKDTASSCLSRYENRKYRKKNYRDALGEMEMHVGAATNSQLTLYFKMPAILAFIFVTGMIGNVTLLYTFCKHSDICTGPRILLINIAVGHILLLVFNVVGKYYFELLPFTLGETECRFFMFLTITPVVVSNFSLMVLSIAKYYRVQRLCPGLGIVLVWTAGSLASLKPAQESVITRYDFSNQTHCDMHTSATTAIVTITLTYFLPLAIIAIFATAKCLRGNFQEDIPGERNSLIVPALAVIFIFTYTPFHLFWLGASIYEWDISLLVAWLIYFSELFLNLNCPLFPVGLYMVSDMFRKPFDDYLTSKHKKDQKEPPEKPAIELYSWEI